AERPRTHGPPDRDAVPLGLAAADVGRQRERPHARCARPERPHHGGEGGDVRDPPRPAAARQGARALPRGAALVRDAGAGGAGIGAEDMSSGIAEWADEAKTRVGFFTDTSVCIGCKACEVACKEWNLIPQDGQDFLGRSYDNTGELNGETWRHVAFIEQEKPLHTNGDGTTGL